MKLTIFNLKGGQGKTTLTLALALSSEFFVVTNDEYSPIDKVLPKGHVKHLKASESLPDVLEELDLIYDFGGYPDKRVVEAVRRSDWLIVPIVYDSPLDMQTSIKTIVELENHTKNIIIVINRTVKDSFIIANAVLKPFFDYPTFEVKKSTAFVKMVEQGKSVEQLCKDNVLFAYHYKTPLQQICTIQNFIREDNDRD